MIKQLDVFFDLLKTPLGILEIISSMVISICVLVLFIFIFINFIEAKKHNKAKSEKKSVVETGTMVLFFLIFYLAIRFKFGQLELGNLFLRISLILTGLIVVVLGCFVNIKGRLDLGDNWANQIKIYKNHTLVTRGVYNVVRHPLYASLIWMFYGGALVYFNYVAFLLNTFVFIPFMYYRAKQEEKLLAKEFKEFKAYRNNVGMFFPRLK